MFQKKVSSRLTYLLVLIAILPITTAAIFSYRHINSVIIAQSEEHLHEVGKNFGLSIFQHMKEAGDKMIEYVHIQAASNESDQDMLNNYRYYFSSIYSQPLNIEDFKIGRGTHAKGLTPQDIKHLLKGKPFIEIRKENKGEFSYIARRIVNLDNRHYMVTAKWLPEFIWGNREDLSLTTDYLVTTRTGDILYLSIHENTTDKQSFITKLKARDALSMDYINNQWPLFLKHEFGHESLIIYVGRSKSIELGALESYRTWFPLAIIMTLLVVVFLSSIQIRRSLVPLNELISGTKNIEQKNFDFRLKMHTGDEFQDLASSFNKMAANLGKQFNALEMMTQLDHLILENPISDHIISVVINNINKTIPCKQAYITIFNIQGDQKIKITVHKQNDTKSFMTNLNESQIRAINQYKNGLYLSDSGPFVFLKKIVDNAADNYYIAPIVQHERIYGSIIIQLENLSGLNQDDKSHVLSIADRVAVALSSAEKERKLYYQAHYDPLTKIPNRQLFREHFHHQAAFAARNNTMMALLYIDLDRFKNVNDSIGHTGGDQVLQQSATRIRSLVRDSDTMARLGGDEFAVLLSEINTPWDAGNIANNIINSLSKPYIINNSEHFLGSSIGITVFPNDGDNYDELLKKADTAMYRAKESGRGTYMFFREDMNTEALERITLEKELHYALDNDEFEIHYQPIVDLRTNRIASAEALLRWNHPRKKRIVGPDDFIAIAESSGMIEDIGAWVLLNACNQNNYWNSNGIHVEHVSVNISGKQFQLRQFTEIATDYIKTANISPSDIVLEITEHTLMQDINSAKKTLQELHELGVKIAIDDFGTGYSSLNYLRELPVDYIKIDKSFMTDIPYNKSSCAIVHSIIDLAHNLDMQVIAEGVEHETQLEFLRQYKCDYVQGYLFSTPVIPEKFSSLARRDFSKPSLGAEPTRPVTQKTS